jgi:hypothetical protein
MCIFTIDAPTGNTCPRGPATAANRTRGWRNPACGAAKCSKLNGTLLSAGALAPVNFAAALGNETKPEAG